MFCDNSTFRENHKKKALVDGKKKIGEKLRTHSVVQTACNWHRWFEKSRQGGGRYVKHRLVWCPAPPPHCPLSVLVSATANLGLIHKIKKKKKISPFPQSSWLPTGMADIKVVLSCGFLIQENDSSN